MKFGKEFSSQMVPEWYETYMDYAYMKTLIKDIHQHNKSKTKTNNNKSSTAPQTLSRNLTLYRSFSGLTTRNNNYYKMPRDLENPAILVKQNGDDLVSYETEFLLANEDGGEYELVFFKRLDDEFNKVDKFYRSKVVEVLNEAEILNKQMDALIAFRIKVENPHVGFDRSSELTRLASDVAASTAALAASTPSSARSRRKPMDSIDEPSDDNDNDDDGIIEMKVSRKKVNEEKPKNSLRVVRPAPLEILNRVHLNNTRETPRSTIKSFLPMDSIDEPSDDNDNDDDSIKEMKVFRKKVNEEKPKNGLRVARPAPLEILDRVYLNNTRETPRSTIKSFLQVPENVELKFSRRNLTKVEAQLNRAFIEFYQKLRLLKSYSFLNMLAFSKIMKKYDKVSSRQCSKSYLKMVDNSYIGSSDEVTKLMERVEVAFIKHFSNSNRSKGMNTLRPKANREKHRETFSLGFFAGCVISLALALILIIRARHLLEHREKDKYMKTLFPLYSLFAFIVLHMTMYAGNIYYWRKYRVNYAFIFGFKQGTELGYREVLLTGYYGLAVLALASVILNLDMDMNPKTHDYKEIIELLPLGVLILLAIVLLCPFNVIYRSSRYFFLTSLLHCVCAPFYKVSLPDFFLADQLTSQVQALRSFQYYICYYGTGDYKVRGNTCKEHPAFKTFLFIIAVIPYTCRLLQCLRRMYEERDVMQGYNGLKYFSTIVAVCMRTAYQLNGNMTWNIIAWISSGIAAICGTYWDFVYDWSLLQRHSSNSWLRDKLLVPYKSVYFGAMALNVLLRFAWMQTVLNIKISFIHKEVLTTVTASLEIIRRGIWNFFRLENEHLNNVGKFRAFKSVPLPFNYAEEEDKED